MTVEVSKLGFFCKLNIQDRQLTVDGSYTADRQRQVPFGTSNKIFDFERHIRTNIAKEHKITFLMLRSNLAATTVQQQEEQVNSSSDNETKT